MRRINFFKVLLPVVLVTWINIPGAWALRYKITEEAVARKTPCTTATKWCDSQMKRIWTKGRASQDQLAKLDKLSYSEFYKWISLDSPLFNKNLSLMKDFVRDGELNALTDLHDLCHNRADFYHFEERFRSIFLTDAQGDPFMQFIIFSNNPPAFENLKSMAKNYHLACDVWMPRSQAINLNMRRIFYEFLSNYLDFKEMLIEFEQGPQWQVVRDRFPEARERFLAARERAHAARVIESIDNDREFRDAFGSIAELRQTNLALAVVPHLDGLLLMGPSEEMKTLLGFRMQREFVGFIHENQLYDLNVATFFEEDPVALIQQLSKLGTVEERRQYVLKKLE